MDLIKTYIDAIGVGVAILALIATVYGVTGRPKRGNDVDARGAKGADIVGGNRGKASRTGAPSNTIDARDAHNTKVTGGDDLST